MSQYVLHIPFGAEHQPVTGHEKTVGSCVENVVIFFRNQDDHANTFSMPQHRAQMTHIYWIACLTFGDSFTKFEI